LSDTQKRLSLTGVDASLQLSYDLLTPDLQTRWRQLAVFPADFDREAAIAIWSFDSAQDAMDRALDALSELAKYSMVEYGTPIPNPSPVGKASTGEGSGSPSPVQGEGWGEGRYHLHDLARLFADARTTAQRRHAEHYKNVLSAANNLYLRGNEGITYGIALFEIEWNNIKAGQAWAATHAHDDDIAARLCNAYPDAGAYCLNLRLHMREWIRWLEAALAAARQLKRRDAEGVHLGNFGVAYSFLGDTRKAIEYYEQRLVIAREIGDRRGEGNALGNLGSAYVDLGDMQKAIKYYE